MKIKSSARDRPSYHITPPKGLLNDPNGLSYFNGFYHIFYQYNKDDVSHGKKSWYHLITKDFINYNDLGIAIEPEFDFENFGVYSGNAKVFDGVLHLFYTGNRKEKKENYKRYPSQCMAMMSEDNEIVSKEVIIPYTNKYTEHYRDPYCIDKGIFLIGAQTHEKKGCLSYVKGVEERTLHFTNDIKDAYMIECPNFFYIDSVPVLIVSPQGVKNTKYMNRNSVVYILEDINCTSEIKNATFLLDYGFDFYAPQVFYDGARYILIPWLGQANTIYPFDLENNWSQVLGMAREVNLIDDKIYQYPVEEYKSLREVYKEDAKSYELEFYATNGTSIIIGDTNNIVISYNEGIFKLDRTQSMFNVNEEDGTIRIIKIYKNKIKVNVFVDNSVIEIYLENGEYTMSSRIFVDYCSSIKYLNVSDLSKYNLGNINII